MAALPEGPAADCMELNATASASGSATIGEIGPAKPKPNRVMIPVIRETVCFYSDDDDICGYVDGDGTAWTLGRYNDGSWFRRRSA